MLSISSSLRNNITGTTDNNRIFDKTLIKTNNTKALDVQKTDGTSIFRVDTSTGAVALNGNLTVTGTMTSIQASNVQISDSNICLAYDNPANSLDIGFYGSYVSGGRKWWGLYRNYINGRAYLFRDLTIEPTTTVNSGSYNLMDLTMGDLNASSVLCNTTMQVYTRLVVGTQSGSGALEIFSSDLDSTSNSNGTHKRILAGIDTGGNPHLELHAGKTGFGTKASVMYQDFTFTDDADYDYRFWCTLTDFRFTSTGSKPWIFESPTTIPNLTVSSNIGIGKAPDATYQLDMPTTHQSRLGAVSVFRNTTGNGCLRVNNSGGINYIQSGTDDSASSSAPLVFSSVQSTTEWARLSQVISLNTFQLNGIVGAVSARLRLNGASTGYSYTQLSRNNIDHWDMGLDLLGGNVDNYYIYSYGTASRVLTINKTTGRVNIGTTTYAPNERLLVGDSMRVQVTGANTLAVQILDGGTQGSSTIYRSTASGSDGFTTYYEGPTAKRFGLWDDFNNTSVWKYTADSTQMVSMDKRTTFAQPTCQSQTYQSASYSLASTNTPMQVVDTSAGNRTVTLPAISSVAGGQTWYFYKSSNLNTLQFDRAGSDTINGAGVASISFSSPIRLVIVMANKANSATDWVILGISA